MTIAAIILAAAVIDLVVVFLAGKHRRSEIERLVDLLAIEPERTNDLLTRLASRSLDQYLAARTITDTSYNEQVTPAHRYLYDPTGLVQHVEDAD